MTIVRPLLTLSLLLAAAGCTPDNTRVDAFLRDAHAMPGHTPSYGMPQTTTGKYTTTGGIDVQPIRPCNGARADARAYARLYVKFNGKPPQPFGYEPQTDAAVMALALADKNKETK